MSNQYANLTQAFSNYNPLKTLKQINATRQGLQERGQDQTMGLLCSALPGSTPRLLPHGPLRGWKESQPLNLPLP